MLIMYTILRHNAFLEQHKCIDRAHLCFSNIPNMNSVYKHTGDENIIGAPKI